MLKVGWGNACLMHDGCGKRVTGKSSSSQVCATDGCVCMSCGALNDVSAQPGQEVTITIVAANPVGSSMFDITFCHGQRSNVTANKQVGGLVHAACRLHPLRPAPRPSRVAPTRSCSCGASACRCLTPAPCYSAHHLEGSGASGGPCAPRVGGTLPLSSLCLQARGD